MSSRDLVGEQGDGVPRGTRGPRASDLSVAGLVDVDAERVGLRKVRSAVAGREPSLPRAQAMARLRASDYPNTHRDLERVLVDPREPLEVRVLAAANLGRIATPASVDILEAGLTIPEESIRAVILASLGRIGSSATLELLVRMRETERGLARSAAHFASVLLSHRLGVPGFELSLPSETEYLEPTPESAVALRLTRATDAVSEYCVRCLNRKPLGIEFSSDHAYEIRMLRRRRIVLLNHELAGADGVSRLQQSPRVLGVMAGADPETGIYYPRTILLTSLAGSPDRLNVFACRLHGQVVLAGNGTARDDRATILLRAITRAGARPTSIEMTFESGELAFASAFASPFVPDKVRCLEDRRLGS